ncbi:MAG: hypothetical protein AAB500_02495 [Patescibacteria group bacterium]
MKKYIFLGIILAVVGLLGTTASAEHSWGTYHWARTENPFTLKLGDDVSSAWDSYLATASTKWTLSSVLDTTVVSGLTNPKRCRATLGRVEVCSSKYGKNGWLGLAQIWITGGTHIAQGVVKLNDTYFTTSRYNKPAWRNMVMCQEVGHTFGLDHQDEDFYNPNLGTCMDYTNNPARDDGAGDNQYPNAHDYEQLETIYAHLDSTTTVGASAPSRNAKALLEQLLENRLDWGRAVRQDRQGRDNVFVRDFGRGNKVLTHVFWVE